MFNETSAAVRLLVQCAEMTLCKGRNGVHFFELCSVTEKCWVSNKRHQSRCKMLELLFFFFFLLECKDLRKHFFVHLLKVGEWKQHGMNAGPQSAVSGMYWREPETRPNPHSRLERTEACAYMQKSAYSCTITPEKCLCCLKLYLDGMGQYVTQAFWDFLLNIKLCSMWTELSTFLFK